jgi:hypothetical protein
MKFNVKAEMFYFSPLHELSAIVDDCATRFSTRKDDEESDVSHGG